MLYKEEVWNYKLTIAIPTYNRVKKLRITLPRVLELSENKSIEIIVSDNCSSDGTQDYLLEMTKKFPQISYYRNSENVGPDRNFLNCFEKATGKYVLLLGDDDLLLEKGIISLMEAIELNPIFIYLNSAGLIEKSNGLYNVGKPKHEEQGLVKYSNKNKLLKEMGIYVTFMSSLVFRTKYVRLIDNKEQYIGTFFIQSHIALRTMEHEGLYIYNTDCCCAASGNVTVGYDLFYVWGKCYGDLMFKTAILSGFDKEVVNEVVHQSFNTTILDFVWNFRRTCSNEKDWNRDDIWLYVYQYTDLIGKYRLALTCPRTLIRIKNSLMLFPRIVRKIGRMIKQS